MKICVISTFPPVKCGIGDYTYELYSNFAQHDLFLDILTYEESEKAFSIEQLKPNITIHRIMKKNVTGWKVWKKIVELSPDIIHLQSSTFLHRRLFNTFVFFKDNKPLITTVHDAPESHRQFHTIPFLRPVYKKSDIIIVHSENVKKSLIEFHKIAETKIIKIPHGVDIEQFNPNVPADEFRKKYGLEDKFVILFFGFLRPGKGIEYLLEAFKKIQNKIQDTKLVIAGGSPSEMKRYFFGLKTERNYAVQLKEKTRSLQLDSDVVFTGYIPDCEMPSCFASADITVFPYLGTSQSGPVHRAMGSGCSIIASCVGGIPEIIKNGESGILIPPKDSDMLARHLLKLYDDKNLRLKLGKNARIEAEKMSWKNVSERIIQQYNDLV